jgi:hypothetical protein
MRLALQAINHLERAGPIFRSAIGGAMGATFYREPVSTIDLDLFVISGHPPLILTLTPIRLPVSALLQQVLEPKRQRRRELAALPFPAKVRIVEQMREAVPRIRASAAPAREAAKGSTSPRATRLL